MSPSLCPGFQCCLLMVGRLPVRHELYCEASSSLSRRLFRLWYLSPENTEELTAKGQSTGEGVSCHLRRL